MKNYISAVIICLNAKDTIKKAILSLEGLTADIIVSDSGSTDGTMEAVRETGATLIQLDWIGYGANKNQAGLHAKNDWILSLDADEYLHAGFANSISEIDFGEINKVYQFRRLNFLGDKPIRYGEWSKDKVTRLFNRRAAQWDTSPVHEQLAFISDVIVVKSTAIICHRTAAGIGSYKIKLKKYGTMMAEKYFRQQKKINWVRIYLSPLFNFMQNYFFRLGFLDGREGFQIAQAHAAYTFEKYRQLKELYKASVPAK